MSTATRRLIILLACQLLLCWLETYLISRISLIGKIGIATVYHQYALLRNFWETLLLLSSFQVAVIVTLYVLDRRSTRRTATMTGTILLIIGLIGLILTFQDFLHTYSHRLLKERFHLGFYLFWLAWMASCFYFLFFYRATPPFPVDPGAPVPLSGNPLTVPSPNAPPFPPDPDNPPAS